MQWLAANHPELVGKYRRLYGQGSYASKEYRTWLSGRINYFKARHGFSGSSGFSHRNATAGKETPASLPPASFPTTASPRFSS
ncbi:uncharacterized protein Mb2609c [Arthrobacter sp. Hiyo8]|nr:uncharacterized protein Mb2609c [Arthrobacter sp. Hiyo8]